jgi:hypothetical protein
MDAFRRLSVPRRLIAGFRPSDRTVAITFTEGGYREFRVDSPLWDLREFGIRRNSWSQVRTTDRIVTMLRAVPATPTHGDGVESRRRGLMIAIALVIAVLAAAMIVVGAVAITA